MSSVDKRVVEMQFDNQQFEKNVQTSLTTIDNLKKSLDFKGVGASFSQVQNAANGVKLDGLASGVQSISDKFSALGIMGITVLQNLTNSAINAGKAFVSSFTIDPIKQGFSEYELKMGSIQTIMAGTGEDLKTVNGYLDDLNTYSDKTIYSFSDMTSNIGKFTNAGVNLKDAVKAIQGISNEAAVSGANTNQASAAMYNFSQALSSGYVKLIDWKSIENANMATKEFKQQLIDSAVAAGTLTKADDGMYKTVKGNLLSSTKNFNDCLQDQWMTSDVLISTLGRYSDETTDIGKKAFAAAQDIKTFSQLLDTLKEALGSGWAKTWQILFGDFNEAKSLWTEVGSTLGDLISKSSDARNNVLQSWKDLGGRTVLIEGIKNAWEGLLSVLKPVKEAFATIFPKVTGITLYDLTIGFRAFTEKLILNKQASDLVKSGFQALFSVLRIGGQVLKGIATVIGSVVEGFLRFIGVFTGANTSVFSFIAGLNKAIADSNVIGKAFEKVGKLIETGFDLARGAVEKLGSALDKLPLDDIKDKVKAAGDAIKDFYDKIAGKFKLPSFDKLKASISGLFSSLKGGASNDGASIFDSIKDKVKSALDGVKEFVSFVGQKFVMPGFEAFASLIERIKDRLSPVKDAVGKISDSLGKANDKIQNTSQSSVKGPTFFDKLKESMEKAWEGIKKVGSKIGEGFSKIMGKISDSLKNGNWDKALDLVNTGIFAVLTGGILKFLKGTSGPIQAITDVIKGFSGVGTALSGTLSSFKDVFASFSTDIKADALKKVAVSIGIITVALIALTLVDSDKLLKATGAMAAAMGTLVGAMVGLNKANLDETGLLKLGVAMIGMGIAIAILAGAMAKLQDLSWEDIAQGIVAIGACCAAIIVLSQALDKSKGGMQKNAKSMILVSASLWIMASAFTKIGGLDWGGFARGMIGFTVMFGELYAFIKMTSTMKAPSKASTDYILAISGAMMMLAGTVKALGALSLEELAKGLISVAVLLAAMTAMLKIKGDTEMMTSTGIAIFFIAAAIKVLQGVVKAFGSMDTGALVQGLGGLATVLVLIVLAMDNIDEKGVVAKAGAIVIMSLALGIMAGVIAALGLIPFGNLLKGLIGVAGAMAIFVGASILLSKFVSPIELLAIAASMVIMGIALGQFAIVIAALGALPLGSLIQGMVALAAVFAIIGVAGLLLGPISPLILLLAIAVGVLGAAALMAGVGMLAAGTGMVALAAAFTALAALGTAGATALVAAIGIIVTGVVTLIPIIAAGIATGMVAFVGALAAGAGSLAASVATLLSMLLSVIATFIPKVANMGIQLIAALLQGIASHIQDIVVAAVSIIVNFINGIASMLPALVQAGINLIVSFVNALADGIRQAGDTLFPAINNLISSIIEFVLSGLQQIVKLLPGIGGALSDQLEDAKSKVRETLAPESMSKIGSDAVTATANGMSSSSGTLNAAASTTASGATSNLQNGMSGAFGIGSTGSTDFANGLLSGSGSVSGASSALNTTALTGMNIDTSSFATGLSGSSNLASGLMGGSGSVSDASSILGTDATSGLNIDASAFSLGSSGTGNFATGLLGGSGDVSDSSSALGTSGTDVLSSITSQYGSVGTESGSSYSDAISATSGNASSSGQTVSNSALNSMSSAYGNFSQSGTVSGSNYAAGLAGKTGSASSSGSSVASSGASGAGSQYDGFYSAGSNGGSGFVNGLSSYMGPAFSAGSALGSAALNAAKSALAVHSPSKKFFEVGKNCDLGAANGINAFAKVAEVASRDMAVGTLDAMSGEMSKTDNLLDGMNATPVIRPVLDLSDVEAGMSKLGSYFGAGNAIPVTGALNTSSNLASGAASSSPNVTNNYTYSIGGVTFNDDGRIREVFESIINELKRKGQMG